jgi:hypothetical protein
MKMMMIMSFVLGIFITSGSSFAEGEVKSLLKGNNQEQASEKPKQKRRRKKVLMCEECGKPETECECEGHGDNEDHDH